MERNLVWRDSYSLWSDVIRKNSKIASAHNNLGNIFMKEGRYEDALKIYKKAISMNPKSSDAWYFAGVAYEALMLQEEIAVKGGRGYQKKE